MTAPLGERLADWLEELGLDGHLAAAGLPTFVRDADGLARWSDPATGERLSPAQLESLDALLHSQGEDPERAVPVGLVQIAREARLRTALMATATHDYASLAAVRGVPEDTARFQVHKAASQHRLLVISNHGRVLVPAFQLTADGEVRPELEPLLRPLLAAGMDPWKAWIWLTQPAGLLGGAVPEQSAADPEESALAATAATRLAERVVNNG